MSIIYSLGGAALIAFAAYLLMASADASRLVPNGPFNGLDVAKYLLFAALLLAAIGAAYLATAWGLWQGKQWAQAVAIAVSGLSLLSDAAAALGLSSLSGAIPIPSQWYLWLGLLAVVSGGVIAYLLHPSTETFFRPDTMPVGIECVHCGKGGIAPGMLSCPFCGQDPRNLIQPVGPSPTPFPDPDRSSYAASRRTKVGFTQTPALAWLIVKSGPDAGQRWDLVEDVQIGRDGGSAVTLHDDYVSRSHARVKFEGGQFFIYDIGSSTGTFVNGRQVQRLMLYDGSQIRLGKTMLEFKRTTPAR